MQIYYEMEEIGYGRDSAVGRTTSSTDQGLCTYYLDGYTSFFNQRPTVAGQRHQT